ncbi:MAG: hypothetical protein J6T82_06195 [Bacteroidaceae bacterium]|jgi:hypothetical protein|nr:hypothetical protein [Bacteroidaceae bacterium]
MKTTRSLILLSFCAGITACTNDTFVEEPSVVEAGNNATSHFIILGSVR